MRRAGNAAGEGITLNRLKRMRLGAVLTAILLTAAPACAQTLIPGGQSIGVAVSTEGAVIVGASDVGSTPGPARLAGLRSGDVIVAIDGVEIRGSAEIAGMLDGDECTVTYSRDGVRREALLKPAYDKSDGLYKLGVWVRDSAAGIGTLTYYDPATGRYGALGHAVTDADAGIVLPVNGGTIYENSIIGVEKGRSGRPGEILGQFYDGGALGAVDTNSVCGIFGDMDAAPETPNYEGGMETMPKDDVHTGKAAILAAVDDTGVREFECEIVRVDRSERAQNRSFTIRITDDELISVTGGIVQGMSGSPVIQDGMLAGAVTHVYVDDPTMGYGVFIDNMLKAG